MQRNKEPIYILRGNEKVENHAPNYQKVDNNIEVYDYLYKIVLVGSASSGKTALLEKWTQDTFPENGKHTMGVDFAVKAVKTTEEKTIKNHFWDTAGKPEYQAPEKYHYAKSHAFILAIDLTAIDLTNDYLTKIKEYSPNVPIILTGTKCDLVESRKETPDAIKKLVKDNPEISAYVETSAKTGENVNQLFLLANKLAHEENQSLHNKSDPAHKKNQQLHNKIVGDLNKYITRIDGYTDKANEDKFHHFKFPFFKNSRAANRKANYELAKELLNKIKELDLYDADYMKNLAKIFNDPTTKRENIIKKEKINTMKDFVDRGINSSELKKVIAEVKQATKLKKG
jgi:small GTP-binding protein